MTYSKVYEPNNPKYREQAIGRLRTMFPHDSVATTVVRHVTRSGMSRSISVLTTDSDGEIRDVSYDVARVLGWSLDHDNGGVRVQGCGMDMAFHMIYSMSRIIHAHTGFVNRYGDADSDTGYAVSNRSV